MIEFFLIGVCVIVPIMVVWLNNRKEQNETNKKTEILLKAIESGANVDTDIFKPQPQKQKSFKEKLLARMTAAFIVTFIGIGICIATVIMSCTGGVTAHTLTYFIFYGAVILAVGIALFITYFIGKRMLAKEMEAEEKSISQNK
jgi:preprotein translocase subunit YajC